MFVFFPFRHYGQPREEQIEKMSEKLKYWQKKRLSYMRLDCCMDCILGNLTGGLVDRINGSIAPDVR